MKPIDIKLPRCAIFSDQQTGTKVPVIVVQAEEASGVKTAGYRLLSGAEGICTLPRWSCSMGRMTGSSEMLSRPHPTSVHFR